jgi:D-proline reductase (dithiol) PrdB
MTTPDSQRFVSYIDKSREYYGAQGFTDNYRWAHFDEVPFTRLKKPLAEASLTLITTASPTWEGGRRERPPAQVFSLPSGEPPEALYTQHRSWDKGATHTEDLDSYFPIHRLHELAAEGRVRLAPRVHGVQTEYSQRATLEEDAPELLRRCQEDGAEAAILVPL